MKYKRILSVLLTAMLLMSICTACESESKRIQYEYGLEDSPYDLTEALTTDSLKELCKDYFMLGVGLTGNAKSTAAVNSLEYMTAVSYTHLTLPTNVNV